MESASFDATVAALYLSALGVLGVFGAHRLTLLRRFRWTMRGAAAVGEEALPVVTVQLPLYNERTVASELIRACRDLDYPRDRLEIQVLDDSDDETRAIVDREVALLRGAGIDARVLRRSDRRGFKAGALDRGLRVARGELLCIFDADFRPPPGFLRDLVGAFEDPRTRRPGARSGPGCTLKRRSTLWTPVTSYRSHMDRR